MSDALFELKIKIAGLWVHNTHCILCEKIIYSLYILLSLDVICLAAFFC